MGGQIGATTMHDIASSYQGPAVHQDAMFQNSAFSDESSFGMHLPDNQGQNLSGTMAAEAGARFTVGNSLCCFDTYPYRCAMHDTDDSFYTRPMVVRNDEPLDPVSHHPSIYHAQC
jgi:hypothetical protein